MHGNRYEILHLIIEGKIEGRRTVSRRQNSWLKDLRTCSSFDIFRAVISKKMLTTWISNLRKEEAL